MKKTFVFQSLMGIILVVSSCLPVCRIHAQGMAINEIGAHPDPSAILDVSSTNKGFLAPRMDSTHRNAIVSPAQSLLIFDTSSHCFEMYYGAKWLSVSCLCTGAPPAPGSISGSTNVCAGQTGVIYSVNPLGGATSYTWTVPADANILAGQGSSSISVTFGSDSGNVSVTANNGCGASAIDTLSISVNSTIPLSPVASSNSPVCAGTNLNLFASNITGAIYTWTGPNGFTSKVQNPAASNIQASQAGTYYVTAMVGGCASAIDSTIVSIGAYTSGSATFTPGASTFTVPSCVTSITITAYGGQGYFLTANDDYSCSSYYSLCGSWGGNGQGGYGGSATGTLAVTPGTTYYLNVGNYAGGSGSGGGWNGHNGGGMTWFSPFSTFDVGSVILVAGGGGGGNSRGYPNCYNGNGGAGGGTTGGNGDGYNFAGGTGGSNSPANGGVSGGTAGQGGNGVYGSSCSGAGGGGGYFGGGGGGGGAEYGSGPGNGWVQYTPGGGGGGSSYMSYVLTNPSTTTGGASAINVAQGGNGQLVITW